jgi:peptide/nickel transport system ATP-binding protein
MNLGVRIPTKNGLVRAVDDLSFSLEPGKVLGVVGESGCGKSMLCRSLLRLLPPGGYLTKDAKIDFNGIDMVSTSEKSMNEIRGRDIAMVFQDAMTALNPVMKVGKQISENLIRHADIDRKTIRAETLALLKAVAIPQPQRTVDCYPHQLSGGMRQRVVIAIALACKPKLLVADEPTTALDVTVQAGILNLLGKLQRELSMAMILVTHDLGVVAGHADEVAVMYGGRIVEQAPTVELFARMRHPYTRALMEAIPKLDTPAHEPLQTIEGQPPDLTNPPPGCRFSDRCPSFREKCREVQPPFVINGREDHSYACFFPKENEGGSDE